MNSVYIGKGKLDGRGVYANRSFKTGEIVMSYNLQKLSQEDFDRLPASEHKFTHSFWGKIYLYPEPARYVNHSSNPNTKQDLDKMCDWATRTIKKGEMITTNATLEVLAELKTFIESIEEKPISDFKRLKGGYRNALVSYTLPGRTPKKVELKRVRGNWHIVSTHT